MKTYKALAFDVDGTLYPNSWMYFQSIPFGLKNYRLLKTFRKVRKELRAIRPIDNFYELQNNLVADELGWSLEKTQQVFQKVMYTQWEQVLYRVKLFPGVIQVLEEAKNRGLKLAVASDFPVKNKLPILGLEGWWDFELATETTNYLKPNPEPFLELAKGLGLEPQEILYVGNSYTYDILGAKQVEMDAAHITKKPPIHSRADLSFSHYKELSSYLFR
jgi:putative hydrolase of the HAD superfamily